MASRAYEAAIAGGVPKKGGGEDAFFGEALAKIGKIDRVREVKAIAADRYSARTDVDAGHGQQKIKRAESFFEKGIITMLSPEKALLMKKISRDFSDALEKQNISTDNLKKIFTIDGNSLLNDQELEALSKESRGINSTEAQEFKNNPRIGELGKKFMSEVDRIFPPKSLEEVSEKLIKRIIKEDDILKEKFEITKKALIKKENSWAEKRKKTLKSLADIVFENKYSEEDALDKKYFLKILRENNGRIGLKNEDIEKVERNRLVLKKILEGFNNVNTSEEAFENLKDLFKDETMSVTENSPKLRVIELRALRQARDEMAEKKN